MVRAVEAALSDVEQTGRPLSLLIVDDDEVDRLSILRALRQADLKAVFVQVDDASSALSHLTSPQFDCVLLDLNLPGRQSGLDVLQAARAAGVDTAIVVVTGQGDEETAVAMLKAGADDYIPKSAVGPERLANCIRHAIRVRASERQTRLAEAALRLSERRLQVALDAGGLGSWHFDPSAGKVVLSAPCKTQLGLAASAEPSADNLRHAIFSDDRQRVVREIEQVLAGKSAGSVEFRIIDGSGSVRWIRAMGRPSLDADGRLARYDGVTLDITDYKERLLEQQRSEQLRERLMAIVGHDLRTPLAAISMAVSMQIRRGALSQADATAAERIARSADRMSRMINQLLDLTRARLGGGIAIDRKLIDAGELCREVVAEVEQAHPARKIELRIDGEARGQWDRDRTAQVVSNLLGNAIQHGSAVGVIRVGVDGTDANALSISVHNENEGRPIPADARDALFDPFRRGASSPSNSERLGLGLYITMEIVKSHRGRIDVDSNDDGTSFRVTLPRG